MIDKISDEEFKAKIDALDLLKQERTDLSEYMEDLITIYKLDPKLFTPEIWFDLINTPKIGQIDNDSRLGIIELRDDFRKKHNSKVGKLQKLNKEIFFNQLDIVLEKIRSFQEELGPEE